MRNQGAGTDLEDQFPSLRTNYFILCLRWPRAKPFHKKRKIIYYTSKTQIISMNRSMDFLPGVVSPFVAGIHQESKSLSCLLLPLAGLPIFILTQRKSPWADPSYLHHSCSIQTPIASQRNGSPGVLLPVSLAILVITFKSETKPVLPSLSTFLRSCSYLLD